MKDFLTALYGDIPDGHWFYIWTLDDDTKQTHWFQDVAPAVKLAKQTTKANVYWPIGLRTQRLTHSQRGEERDIAAIIAFVADVDFQDETHPYAPADEPAAMSFTVATACRLHGSSRNRGHSTTTKNASKLNSSLWHGGIHYQLSHRGRAMS